MPFNKVILGFLFNSMITFKLTYNKSSDSPVFYCYDNLEFILIQCIICESMAVLQKNCIFALC